MTPWPRIFLILLAACTFSWLSFAQDAPTTTRKAVHRTIPYIDKAVSPAEAVVIRAVRKYEPRMVREDIGQTVALDNRYARAAKKAVARYERAADLGYVMAHYNLARALSDGRGIKRDIPRALKSFALAAGQGNVPAMLRLAEFHMTGAGTPKNRVEAQAYYFVAASLQNQAGSLAIKLLRPHLNQNELEEVRKRAQAIRDALPKIDLILQRSQEQELLEAAAEGDLDKVDSLLRAGVDANAINALGRTGIVTAAWRGHQEVVSKLLNAGVEIDAADNEGRTALMWVSINGHPGIVNLLLEEGALVDVRDNTGATPLIRAAWNGHEEIVRSLMDAGADTQATDDAGMSALDRSDAVEELRISQILRQGPSGGTKEILVLLEDDDGGIGALALLNRQIDGKDVVLNKANEMIQVAPDGKAETGEASKEFLEREFGNLLEALPPSTDRDLKSRKRKAKRGDQDQDWIALLLEVWPVLIIFAVVIGILLYFLIRGRGS